MHEDLLSRIGLSTDESTVYLALLSGGPQGAGDLLKRKTSVKRGLLYKVLDRLIDRGLVTEKKEGKKVFAAQPPDMLLALVEDREAEIKRSREALASAMPELKSKYNLSTERPMIRFFEGIEGLRRLYDDKLNSGAKDLYFIRAARAETYRETFGNWFSSYLKRQTESGIRVHALTVDDENTNHDPALDAARHVLRTWLRPEDYTAPTHIDVYGDRVAFSSFGKEIFGVIIESKPVATAIREIFILADKGAKTLKILHNHPPVQPSQR